MTEPLSAATPEVVAAPKTAPRLHLGFIDGLRALLALYVVCVHILPRAWGDTTPSGPLKLLAKCLSGGHLAVTAFIVVSGFCLMLPVLRAETTLRGGAWTFYKRRYLRIALPFYAAFLLSTVCLLVCRGATPGNLYPDSAAYHIALPQIIGHLLLIQILLPGGALPNNGVLWSVSVEFLIYLWFPLLILLWRRLGPARATVIGVIFGYALLLLLRRTPLGPMTFQYYAAFALGTLAANIATAPTARWRSFRERIRWDMVAAAGIGLVVLLCAALGWKRAYTVMPALDGLMAVGIAALIIHATHPRGERLRRILQFKPLEALGAVSFSLYLIHYPAADVICQYAVNPSTAHFSQHVRLACLALVVIPFIALLAFGFFQFFERPAHELSRRAR